MEGNVITARFAPASHTATISGTLWQWDWGQVLRIEGLELPAAYEVQFSSDPYFGQSETRIATADGVLIPNNLLRSGSYVYAHLFIADSDAGETEYRISLPVTRRPPPPPDGSTPDQQTAIEQAIAALNEANGRAESAAQAAEASAATADTAATLAKSWAVGQTGAREGEETDNARSYKDAAEAAADRAETARDAAEAAAERADAAEAAADRAEAARDAAEAAAEQAEASVGDASWILFDMEEAEGEKKGWLYSVESEHFNGADFSVNDDNGPYQGWLEVNYT